MTGVASNLLRDDHLLIRRNAMIPTIARLRLIADETEKHARAASLPPVVQAELFDLAARWHWLAGEAGGLCARARQLTHTVGECNHCEEKCRGVRAASATEADVSPTAPECIVLSQSTTSIT